METNIFLNSTRIFAFFIIVYFEVNAKSVHFSEVPVGIVNGTDAKEGEFPYLVQLRERTTKLFMCGGSIIGDKWVLTAGHCVTDLILESIVYGTNQLYNGVDAPNKTIQIKKSYRHPNYTVYDGVTIYDIAILELTEKIIFGDNAKPIKLADAGQAVPFHVNGSLAGWGYNKSRRARLQEHLQKIELQLLTDQECKTSIDSAMRADIFNVTHDLCSDDHWNGECNGDSGSPFVINGTQYGVVSWSDYPCGSSPGTYSRLPNPDYRGFIKKLTGI